MSTEPPKSKLDIHLHSRAPPTLNSSMQQTRTPVDRLPLLIELLYAFAIGNGLSDGVKGVVERCDTFNVVFVAVAFLLATSDWLYYYLRLAEVPYRGLSRLLLDLVFPVLLYLLLYVPALDKSFDRMAYVTNVVAVYFICSTGYALLLRVEERLWRSTLLKVNIVCLLLSIGAVPARSASLDWFSSGMIGEILSTSAVILWATYNFSAVHAILKERHSCSPTSTL